MYPEGLPKRSKGSKSLNSVNGVATRHIVGLVVFDGEKFLLLHRVLHWSGWEFPKGGIKDSESIIEAIGRELFEETAIPKFEMVGKIDELDYFDDSRNLNSHIQNYLIRVSSNNRISFENQSVKNGERVIEHDDFKWCFPKEAVSLLKHKNMKDTLKKAIKMLALETER